MDRNLDRDRNRIVIVILNLSSYVSCILLFLATSSFGYCEWQIEGSIGLVHNFTTTLKVDAITIDADYETRSLEGPLYYSVRAGSQLWDVELIHQKIYLQNPSPPLQSFSISHGYNLVLLNYVRPVGGVLIRFGGGVVVAHPEVNLSGHSFEPGYNLTGPSFQLSLQKRLSLSERFFLSAEGKFTAGRAQFSIDQSKFSAPNVALHALFGFGVKL